MNSSTLRPVDELLWSWPTVCRMATNEWAKGFARSIASQSRRRNWTPSPKQHALMNSMVNELYRDTGEGDFEVIE
ncbi:hypothetical protein [Paracoccus tegillarcae]|uniref:Uncharacterized protein n=1 Tax=Paracoccus tegillarcae TaxID=1529068 RepID=A0A2K9EMI5_9RHOB|nr:hypothetical protein [Paracoccus tegillarcae]AUH34647.1 hypothetical protein CUV01_15780 [Paracoccus tegillarcae]